MKSQRKFSIELFEESKSVNLYVIHFEGEKESEFEKFINEFIVQDELLEDLQRITRWIDKISETGALERYFRPESKMSDGVNAVPIDVSKLRLYCLRISDEILILGNGGYKPPEQHNYNSDAHLSSCVEVLASLDYFIKNKTAQGSITISGKTISGDLTFYIKT